GNRKRIADFLALLNTRVGGIEHFREAAGSRRRRGSEAPPGSPLKKSHRSPTRKRGTAVSQLKSRAWPPRSRVGLLFQPAVSSFRRPSRARHTPRLLGRSRASDQESRWWSAV